MLKATMIDSGESITAGVDMLTHILTTVYNVEYDALMDIIEYTSTDGIDRFIYPVGVTSYYWTISNKGI